MDVLIIYGSIITFLVAIVGYFLNKWITAIDAVIDKLTTVVANLNTTVALLQTNQNNFSSNEFEKHRIIDSRFTSHSDKLHEYGLDITALKVDVSALKTQRL